MYERFTDRARKVMQLANEAAHSLNYEYITTGHVLLGLLQEGTGLAANALKNLDIDPNKLHLEIEKAALRDSFAFIRDPLPQSPCVKQLLADAVEEADLLDRESVRTEHLLLALIRREESVAAQALINLGLTLEGVRGEVLRLLGVTIPAEKTSYGPPLPKADRDSAARERIRSLEQQLWNVRVVLGVVVGGLAGALLLASFGAVMGVLLGGLIAALGRRVLGILSGGVVGTILGCLHLPNQGGELAGALLGALTGFLIAEIGGTSERRGFRNRWWR